MHMHAYMHTAPPSPQAHAYTHAQMHTHMHITYHIHISHIHIHMHTHITYAYMCVRICVLCVQVRGGSEPGSPTKRTNAAPKFNGEIGGDGRMSSLSMRTEDFEPACQPASSIHSGGVGIESDSEEEREQQQQEARGAARGGTLREAQGGCASPVRSGDHHASSSCSERSPDHRSPNGSDSAGPQRVPAPASSAGVAALARMRSTRGSR